MDMRHHRIFKYQLEPNRRQLVYMPLGAKPLSVAEQNGMLVLWASVPVDPDTRKGTLSTPRVFVVVTTGDLFNDDGKTYIGSATLGKQGEEWFVAHVYEQEGGHQDPIDDRVSDDWAQIQSELSES